MVWTKGLVGIVLASVLSVALVAPVLSATVAAPSTAARRMEVNLQPGPFAPGASGEVEFRVRNGVLAGELEAEDLPALGAHAFYVLWFVRTDTGDKAFLGPIVGRDSILFFRAGDGELRFRASAFTDGDAKGSGISLGPKRTNLFVVIAEDHIDTFMPFPISAPPSSFALMATF